jgi:DnaJ-class molecular chaperone
MEYKGINSRMEYIEDKIMFLTRRLEPLINHTNLENYIKYMIEDIYEEAHIRIRIPHRCPVCTGTTYDGNEGTLCIPCDGTGIVWG